MDTLSAYSDPVLQVQTFDSLEFIDVVRDEFEIMGDRYGGY